jgi:hypothetical protein
MNYEPKSHDLESLKGNTRLSETVEQPNSNRIVVTHKRHITPKYGDSGEYVTWKRTVTYVRNSGELVVHEYTEAHIGHCDEWHTEDDYTHTFELADDNVTVAHDGREWDEYAEQRARELTNTRWHQLRSGKYNTISERDAVKNAIESQI